MKITLIGMSNSGKTYWSKRLEKSGFKRFGCDDMIGKELVKEIARYNNPQTHDVAKWMGQPFEEKYKENSRKYLELETLALKKIIGSIRKSNGVKIVVDTTGSIIYTDKMILETLKRLTKIIYLDTPNTEVEKMSRLYFENPKPVIWGNSYKKKLNEDGTSTLKRCYPGLLEYRIKKYRENAHLVLNYYLLRTPEFTTENLVNMLVAQHDKL